MIAIIIFLVIVLTLGGLIWGMVYIYQRNQKQSAKNVERGLKMVPLLIHLPPISEDSKESGRDARDLIDENISKAQVIYNIVASSLNKDKQRNIFGQRHFAFEIVGHRGFVNLYATVPISLVEVVKQALESAYPAVQLEQVADHNIFSKVGGVNAVVGGEVVLKQDFAYPIATYQDIKRDTMQAFLNAMSTLDKEDGVGIQILLRPAGEAWRKAATAISSSKRKGKDKSSSGSSEYARQLTTALWKAPEAKEQKTNDLSNLDQSIVDSIDDKTKQAGFEVMIRVVASSNINSRSQAILRQIVATFSLFDAPGKNGFKFEPIDDTRELATSYIMRYFPQNRTKDVLNSIELATLFHFPDQRNIPTSQLERQGSKQVDGPRNMPDSGMLLGYNIFRGAKKAVRLSVSDRQRHLYSVGQTGTGKSTFLENLALQDMIDGNGFAFIDPHGDTAEKLLSMVPRERTEDVIYFSPSDMDFPLGLNLFEAQTDDQKDFLIQEAINMLYKLYDPQHQGIIGPRYEHLFRSAALTIMAGPDGGTFIDIPKLFVDSDYLEEKLKYVKNQDVLDFWRKEMVQAKRSNEFGDLVNWFSSKFGAFRSNSMMANIIGQAKSAFDLREIMDNKKILLVNLSKGRMGDLNSKLLGMIFVMKIQAAAMSRANIAEDQRVDFALYVDEFQNFSTDSFATILSEARKYHLNLMVANQFTTQLTEEIRDAVFGNIGTIVAFRIGQNDVESLSRYFQPAFDGDDLLRVPNYNTIARTLINGVPTQAFSMATLPPLGKPNEKLGIALKQLTAAKYGRPRKEVEAEISQRMKVPPSQAILGTASAGPGNFAPKPAAPPAGSFAPVGNNVAGDTKQPANFLNQWVAKKPQPQAGSSLAPIDRAAVVSEPLSPVTPAHTSITSSQPGSSISSAASDDLTTPLAPLTSAPNTDSGNLTQSKPTEAIPGRDNISAIQEPPAATALTQVAEPNLASTTAEPSPAPVAPAQQGMASSSSTQQEVSGIAGELRQQLKGSVAEAPESAQDSGDLKQSNAMANNPVSPAPNKADGQNDEPGDTISIDPDGTLHLR